MKSNFLKLNVLFLFAFAFMVSCESSDDIEIEAEPLSVSDIEAIEEIEVVDEEINASIEFAFLEEEYGIAVGRGVSNLSYFPDCLTKTVVITDNMKTITLDFGDGCEVRGHFKAGVLTMSYEKNPDLHTRTISVTYDGFKVGNKSIEGTYSIVRVRKNDNENPQSTSTFDITVTWDDGSSRSRSGEKVREWVEGADTGRWNDNVYLITGHWITTKRNGTIISGNVDEYPLRREIGCRNFVSGVIDLIKNDRSGSLNFGDGECDKEAILTLEDGTEIVITLH